MDIKKLIIIPVIMLIFYVSAYAEEGTAKYSVKGEYSPDDHIYTVDVYLETDEYIAAGMFGMAFDENISPVWHDGTAAGENIGYMQIDKANVTFLEPTPLYEARESLSKEKYMVVMWGMNETDANTTGHRSLHLGTVTVENVLPDEDGYPAGWTDEPFYLLNWYDTELSQESVFADKDENDDTSASINEEFWRSITAEEQAELGADAPAGYYQGYVVDADGNSKRIDIDFEFTTSIEAPSIAITGSVQCYNPKNAVKITAYRGASATGTAYTAKIISSQAEADGRITYRYKVKVPSRGSYVVVYEKQAHLTYTTTVTIEESERTKELEETLKLYCGDIDGDGHIKYPDRVRMIRFLNMQSSKDAYAEAHGLADLNGDGRVNLYDLHILKSNMNKTYN